MAAETTTPVGHGQRLEPEDRGNTSANHGNRHFGVPARGAPVGDMTARRHVPGLSQFFRMAVAAGVESAGQLHIDRGDDIDARDFKGQTPLMLSAARNKLAICRLLIAAGADVGLLNPSGMDALGIARAAGAHEAASVIEAASLGDNGFAGPAHMAPDVQVGKAESPPAADHPDAGAPAPFPVVPEPGTTFAPVIESTCDEDGDATDSTGWQAEEDLPPPKDDPDLYADARAIGVTTSKHRPIDSCADWDDFDVSLPEWASPLPRADDTKAGERLRLVLLRAIREGSVPRSAVEDLMPDDENACAFLGMVINDLGAEMDERFESSASHENFKVFVAPEEKPDEEDAIAEALAVIDDQAARRNEPLRIYLRECQRTELLTAEAELAFGQAMERGVEKALDALAAWPCGIGAVLDAAKKVASGAQPLRWLSAGPGDEPEPSPGVEPDAGSDLPTEAMGEEEEEGDSRCGLGAREPVDALSGFCADVQRLSGLAIGTSQDDPGWSACRAALASLGLTRRFLMELADSGLAAEDGPALAFTQAMKACRHARDQMIVANLRLVVSIAKKYLFSGEPLDDLLQEGNMGLMKAVDRYDWRRGFRFSTYATWWIRQQVGRHVADRGKTIRLPVHAHEQTRRIARATQAFELRCGHAPTVEDIAALVELPIRKVLALAHASLEQLPLHEIDALDDHIAADAKDQFTARDPMDIVADIQLIGFTDRILGTLRPKEGRILRMRFGIGIADSMTLEEVGARFDVTRERVRQIEAKVIRKLRHPARLGLLLRELGGPQPPEHDERKDEPGFRCRAGKGD